MKNTVKVILSFIILTMILCIGVLAINDDLPRILNAYTEDGSYNKDDYGVYVYIYREKAEKEVTAHINDGVNNIPLTVEKDTNTIPCHTFVLIDNSYTVKASGQVEGIKQMVVDLVNSKNDGDIFFCCNL